MSQAEKRLFLSYSWADRATVEPIDLDLQELGIAVIRDVRENSFMDSIHKYMQQVRKTDAVLMILSDSFLKSRNCMYEVLELYRDEDYRERLMVLLAGDFGLLAPRQRPSYIRYWQGELERLRADSVDLGIEYSTSVARELVVIRHITETIGDFMTMVSDALTYKVSEPQEKLYSAICRRLGIPPTRVFRPLLRQIEDKLYSTRIRSEIQELNGQRQRLLQEHANPEELELLLSRRFRYLVDTTVRPLLDRLIQRGAPPEWIAADPVRQMLFTNLTGDRLSETAIQAIRQGSDLLAAAAGHRLLGALQVGDVAITLAQLLSLLDAELPPTRLAIASQILALRRDASLVPTLAERLRELTRSISGQEDCEAWVLMSQGLRSLDPRRYRQEFMRAHYVFLALRDEETKPYNHPLLLLHSDISPADDDYSALLEGDATDGLASVWMLSLFGGNRTLFGEGNPAPVQLTPKARDGLIQLTQKARDGRTQWRLCNAIVETHLTDLLGWVREQGDRRELLEGTVTIHHYQFGVIPEPYAAAFLRAAGYLARLARDAGSVREADETHRNLERRYYRLSGTGDPKLVAALATGLGYIGDWKPVLEVFENRRVREQATWMDLTAKNVFERWILPNRSELEAAFSWIQKRLDSIADLPPEDRSTLLQLRELVWKRRDETDF